MWGHGGLPVVRHSPGSLQHRPHQEVPFGLQLVHLPVPPLAHRGLVTLQVVQLLRVSFVKGLRVYDATVALAPAQDHHVEHLPRHVGPVEHHVVHGVLLEVQLLIVRLVLHHVVVLVEPSKHPVLPARRPGYVVAVPLVFVVYDHLPDGVRSIVDDAPTALQSHLEHRGVPPVGPRVL